MLLFPGGTLHSREDLTGASVARPLSVRGLLAKAAEGSPSWEHKLFQLGYPSVPPASRELRAAGLCTDVARPFRSLPVTQAGSESLMLWATLPQATHSRAAYLWAERQAWRWRGAGARLSLLGPQSDDSAVICRAGLASH
eukprot:gene9511-biopygen5795